MAISAALNVKETATRSAAWIWPIRFDDWGLRAQKVEAGSVPRHRHELQRRVTHGSKTPSGKWRIDLGRPLMKVLGSSAAG